jgi:hypothetical protein
MRYFCTDSDQAYEQARLALDQAWGHAEPVTCIDPAAVAPRDAEGRIVLAVNHEYVEFPAAAQMLEYMISIGAAVEIAAAEYAAAVHVKP